jgi:hypothetical protein
MVHAIKIKEFPYVYIHFVFCNFLCSSSIYERPDFHKYLHVLFVEMEWHGNTQIQGQWCSYSYKFHSIVLLPVLCFVYQKSSTFVYHVTIYTENTYRLIEKMDVR